MTSDFPKNKLKAGFYIVSTPIGNLDDISFRAIKTLNDVDLIACEDTRVSKKLLSHYNIKTPLFSVHNYNEKDKVDFIKNKIKLGFAIALVSDAGTPLISDPGYKIVSDLRENDFYITIIPGASAVIGALTLSGFPTNKFSFIGFVPTKLVEKSRIFENIKNFDATTIFYESPNRIIETLRTIKNILPDRKIAIAREMTKIYEEVKIGTASELLQYFSVNTPKGEFVGLVYPYVDKCQDMDAGKIEKYLRVIGKKLSLKDASELLSVILETPKKNIYNIGIRLNKKEEL